MEWLEWIHGGTALGENVEKGWQNVRKKIRLAEVCQPEVEIKILTYLPYATTVSIFGRVTPGLPRKSAQTAKAVPSDPTTAPV